MNDDQFTKLFKYIEKFRTEVNSKLDHKASQDSMEQLINTLNEPITYLPLPFKSKRDEKAGGFPR